MNELGNAEAHITIEVKPGSEWDIHPTFTNGLQDLEPGGVVVDHMARYREVPEDYQALFTEQAYTHPKDSVWVAYKYWDDNSTLYYLPTKVFLGAVTHK
jgi:hypothetical protein